MDQLNKFVNWPTLFFISSVFLFSGLGSYGLLETSEARYAEISWEMARSGDWTTPRYNFIKHFHKPPLIYWAAAASIKVFGENEFAVRFPQAVFGLAGILAVFFLGRILFDKLTGFLAGLVLLSTLEYFALSRYLVTDMLLTLFLTLALLFYCRGLEHKFNWLFFFLSLSGAMMTKGPVGILLVALIIIGDLILAKRGKEFTKIAWFKGLGIILLVSLPWFIHLCLKNPGLLEYFIFYHTIDRFFTTAHHRAGSPFYFIPVFLLGLLPWTPLLPDLIKNKYFDLRQNISCAHYRLLTLWIFLPLIFFSLSSSKQVNYLLPIFPAAALLVGKMWRDSARLTGGAKEMNPLRISLILYLLGFSLLAVILFLFFFYSELFSDALKFDLASMDTAILTLGLLALAGMGAAFHALRWRSHRFFFPSLFIISLLGFSRCIASVSSIESYISPTSLFINKIQERLQPGDRIATFRCMINGLPFYTGQRIIAISENREIQFEDNPAELQDYLFDDKSKLGEMANSSHRLFLAIKRRHFTEVQEIIKSPLHILAETPSYMLLSNRP